MPSGQPAVALGTETGQHLVLLPQARPAGLQAASAGEARNAASTAPLAAAPAALSRPRRDGVEANNRVSRSNRCPSISRLPIKSKPTGLTAARPPGVARSSAGNAGAVGRQTTSRFRATHPEEPLIDPLNSR